MPGVFVTAVCAWIVLFPVDFHFMLVRWNLVQRVDSAVSSLPAPFWRLNSHVNLSVMELLFCRYLSVMPPNIPDFTKRKLYKVGGKIFKIKRPRAPDSMCQSCYSPFFIRRPDIRYRASSPSCQCVKYPIPIWWFQLKNDRVFIGTRYDASSLKAATPVRPDGFSVTVSQPVILLKWNAMSSATNCVRSRRNSAVNSFLNAPQKFWVFKLIISARWFYVSSDEVSQ